jgi:hypothetical protein
LEALISKGSKSNVLAAQRAIVVFPIPGGPIINAAPPNPDFK